MVSALLIVATRVGRSDVEALERIGVRLNAKRYADEPSRVRHLRDGRPGDVEVDGAILEVAVGDDGQHRVVVGLVAKARPQRDRALTLVDHGLGSGGNQSEVADAIQMESPSTGWGRDRGSHGDGQ
jgi:hypothetical protein